MIALQLARREEKLFAQQGLSRGEVGVLVALRSAGPPHRLSPTALVNGLMISSAGVTGRLDRLERARLIRRLRDPDDRRGVIVELTAKGGRAIDQAVLAYAQSQPEWTDRLSFKEAATLERLLSKLLAGLTGGSDEARNRRRSWPRKRNLEVGRERT